MPDITPSYPVLQKLLSNPLDSAGLSSPGCANGAGSSHHGNSRLLKEPPQGADPRGEVKILAPAHPALQSAHFAFAPCAFYLALYPACGRASVWLSRRSRTRWERSCAYRGEKQWPSGTPAGGLVLAHKVLRGSSLHKDYFQTPELRLNVS